MRFRRFRHDRACFYSRAARQQIKCADTRFTHTMLMVLRCCRDLFDVRGRLINSHKTLAKTVLCTHTRTRLYGLFFSFPSFTPPPPVFVDSLFAERAIRHPAAPPAIFFFFFLLHLSTRSTALRLMVAKTNERAPLPE